MEYSYYITPVQYNLALINGISRRTLDQRVRGKGMKIDEACNKPLKTPKIPIDAELKKLLKLKGITSTIYRKRILDYSWSEEKALNTPIMTKEEIKATRDKSNRKVSLESYAIAAKNGISVRTVTQRLYTLNWGLEKAINTPIIPKGQCANSKNVFNEKRYK